MRHPEARQVRLSKQTPLIPHLHGEIEFAIAAHDVTQNDLPQRRFVRSRQLRANKRPYHSTAAHSATGRALTQDGE